MESRKHKLSPDREDPVDVKVPSIDKRDTDKDVTSATPSISSDVATCENDDTNSVSPDVSKASANTALVAEHYNTLKEKGISQRNQSRIVYMRNFNNWVKSMLINKYLGKIKQSIRHKTTLKVLDMCCGKGGDLLKWKKAGISHLICTDVAEVSLEQCQDRYNDVLKKSSRDRTFSPLFTAEFVTADCTKVRLRERFKDPSMQLDFVSCQFAFHYSFESLPQAECMLRNAAESLKTGGYFIGTIPDAYDIVSRWQKCDGNKFGNDVYSIEFLPEVDKTKPPLFGAKYNFHLDGVVDCPEFLVHLPTLRKLALKFGLELISFERFETFYEHFKDEGKVLLGNMQALETYPPCNESSLVGDPERDYNHVREYKHDNHRKIGTLSQSEWDVISLYAVFVFQKMKTIWNSEGKPEYVKL
ncbi:mRNA cap guanine-N7 methyltransferase isoform X2 [Pseudomyrmex gracilis]|uniref:mRNA cap guanine-N7 methyltransferase isoform X2 n=1 Tax=Pseudomyrmex gracilis TaxID=219809 RepID=UPI000995A27A|nr:mRNA cap guanine-N7 methyltransferase isoform X2 [Pseudomyrmex gracilis]